MSTLEEKSGQQQDPELERDSQQPAGNTGEAPAAQASPAQDVGTFAPLPGAAPSDTQSEPAQEAVPVAGEQAAPQPQVSGRRPRKDHGWFPAAVQSLAGTVVIALFVITFVVQAFQIPSESMENTLLIGDYLLVDKVHFGQSGFWGHLLPYANIGRGDIIVFRYPVNPTQHFVKRVIAVPGDHVRLVNKRVYVNGALVPESYVVFRSREHDEFRDDFPRTDYVPRGQVESYWWRDFRKLVERGALIVPADEYFVMGDNRDESYDSRYWGFVPRENIIGRPLLIYWSVASAERQARDNPTDDRFLGFAYAVTHIFQDTRWNRTFRLVR